MQCVIHYHPFRNWFWTNNNNRQKAPTTIPKNWCMLFVGYRCYTLGCYSIPLISVCSFPSFDCTVSAPWSKSIIGVWLIGIIPLQNRKFQNVEGRFRVFGSLKIIRAYPNGSTISISSLQTLRKQLKICQNRAHNSDFVKVWSELIPRLVCKLETVLFSKVCIWAWSFLWRFIHNSHNTQIPAFVPVLIRFGNVFGNEITKLSWTTEISSNIYIFFSDWFESGTIRSAVKNYIETCGLFSFNSFWARRNLCFLVFWSDWILSVHSPTGWTPAIVPGFLVFWLANVGSCCSNPLRFWRPISHG